MTQQEGKRSRSNPLHTDRSSLPKLLLFFSHSYPVLLHGEVHPAVTRGGFCHGPQRIIPEHQTQGESYPPELSRVDLTRSLFCKE